MRTKIIAVVTDHEAREDPSVYVKTGTRFVRAACCEDISLVFRRADTLYAFSREQIYVVGDLLEEDDSSCPRIELFLLAKRSPNMIFWGSSSCLDTSKGTLYVLRSRTPPVSKAYVASQYLLWFFADPLILLEPDKSWTGDLIRWKAFRKGDTCHLALVVDEGSKSFSVLHTASVPETSSEQRRI